MLAGKPATGGAAAVDFQSEIAPLLLSRCVACHSGVDPQGKLDLTTREGLLRGGENGPAWNPETSGASLIAARLRAGEMPPEEPLPADEQERLLRWLSSGADWTGGPLDLFRVTTSKRAGYDWWSLQPLRLPPLPVVSGDWCRTPVDRFVLEKLHAAGLTPAPPASRRELIRRLSFDLLGLPPTPEEIDAFVRDDRPDAYEQLVDRLLASPHYGIRWGRHWLDLARFGESQGFERDKLRENAWPYRDWVIDALNADLPYDEFARQQLAGDVLAAGNAAGIVATGFLVAGPWDEVGQNQQSAAMKLVVRQDELEDYVSLVGQTFLGLTVHCARCHDHKFDPIRQTEYYQLAAALDGVWHGSREVETAATTSSGEPSTASIYAVVPRPPGASRVLLRGNPNSPGETVAPSALAAVPGPAADWGLSPDADDAARRRRLAEWVTSPDNPLFARVQVNRLWQHHFGVGLVSTTSDFGFNGGRPSHPELLDWLAFEFRRNGYGLKALHRLLVTSAAYRQSSRFRAAAAAIDADNRLLWRMSPRRLEAETLRDATLQVAGELNDSLGGPGYRDFETFVRNSQFYTITDPEGAEFQRRTIYRTNIRSGRSPLLDVFDCPDPSTKTPERAVTVTPLQALSLLNNSFLLRMADRFAVRTELSAGGDAAAQARWAIEAAFGRPASNAEAAAAAEFIQQHGLAEFCRVLFNASEFLYVD